VIAPRTFRLEVDERGVAVATLDRPERLNALLMDTYRELRDLALDLEHEASVKALVLTGAGRGFCSGGDMHEVVGALVGAEGPALLAYTRLMSEVVLALRRLAKPVIAAVNGPAVGGGAALALAADLRLAAPEANIGFVFPRLGLSGAEMGVSWLLPRIVGLGRAAELLMLGDLVDAATAARLGIYNEVVGDGRLLDEALALAARLAAGPSFALGITKTMLERAAHMSFETALEAEALAQQICMRTQDFREGYQAWLEERKPRFTGR
jgi:enoyl-CoA hydratase/carnithine racemase